MKASDLKFAMGLTEARSVNETMLMRLEAGERLSLIIGTAGNESAIVLTPGYLAGLRADLIGALKTRIAENDAALAACGVEL